MKKKNREISVPHREDVYFMGSGKNVDAVCRFVIISYKIGYFINNAKKD